MAKFRARCGRAWALRKGEDVRIGHITNGVHVPTWLAPQMFRLYDRHLGNWLARAQRRSEDLGGTSRDVDDGELWETHLALKSRLLEFVRRRAMEQAERRGEPKENLRRLGTRAESGCADDWICAAVCDLQAREFDSARISRAWRRW